MNKGFVFAILFVFGFLAAYGQSPYCSHHGSCLNESDPSNKESVSFLNKVESEYKKSILYNTKSRNTTIELPIVVHIIHDNGPENISDDQVHLAIQHLNEAFANGGAYTSDIGIDTKIQFCLAQRDTLGNAINGIIRHQSSLTDMSTHFSNIKIAEIAHFNPIHYINIRIVKKSCYGFDCSNAGYAVPGYQLNQSFTNGITIQYDYFGKDAKVDNVIAHEMGHFLGLYHTFYEGCKNDNCLEDGDKVCDTPPDKRVNEHCFYPSNSCNSDEDDSSINNPFRSKSNGGLGDQNDLVSNFMDYNFKECKTSFTEGQSIRMDFFIHTLHSSLLKSKACLSPCINAPEISCSLDKNTYEVGENINFNSNVSQSSMTNWTLNDIPITNPVDHLDNLPVGNYALMGITKAIDVNCEPDTCLLFFDIFCPVEVAFIYNIVDSSLVFDIDVSLASFHQLSIYNSIGTNIYSSLLLHDSLTLPVGEYQLCLEANNGLCMKSNCKYVTINPKNVEICDNSLDDDNDGFVDGFDSDCPCIEQAYQSQCDVRCQLIPEINPNIKMKLKWVSEVTSDDFAPIVVYEENDSVKIISRIKKYQGNDVFGNPIYDNNLIHVNGKEGSTINTYDYEPQIEGRILIIKENKNSDISFYYTTFDTLHKVKNFVLEKSIHLDRAHWCAISSSDINADGIAEIIVGTTIINAENMEILAFGLDGQGCRGNQFSLCSYTASVAADFLPSEGLELAAGNTVYSFNITNTNSQVGNIVSSTLANGPIFDGLTSFGDIDGDGQLEIIVVREPAHPDGGRVTVWNPISRDILATGVSYPQGNSLPSIIDIDDDCYPEIIVTYSNKIIVYKYDGTSILKEYTNITINEPSFKTMVSGFDFNQDGVSELVHRDETFLRIINGITGISYDSISLMSTTGTEYPIIVDIDKNGQAEILISGYLEGETPDDARIYCFESSSTPWAPARSVWNQYGYHVTNVNDDLTIPRHQQNAAAFFDTDSCAQFTCPQPYNNFMVQATYRTQEGCVVWPASDVSLNVMRYECNADSLIFYLVVGNEGNKNITEDTMNLSIYATIPDMTTSPLDRHTIYLSRDVDGNVSRSDTIRLAMVMPTIDIKSILFRINDAGLGGAYSALHGLSPTLECDYENNIALVAIDISKRTLDLGPDIHKCRTEVITLDASSGFVSYLWSDLSEDDIFITSEAGVYSLIATDQCGRRYQDTVTFTIDESLKPKLGPDILLCEGDTTSISVGSEFTWVQWYPVEMVSCDTCFSTSVTADTTFDLVLISNKSGCIDADTVTIDIKALPRSEKQTSICAGTSIDFYGQEIDAAGKYEHRLGHCDSLIILDVTLLRRDSTILSHDICVGDSILVFDTWYDSPTEATLTGKNVYGCDSIVQVSLKVIDTLTSVQSLSFCEGDSIFVQDRWIKIAGTYDYAFTSSRGCDSIATFELVEIPTSSSVNNFSFCQGDSIYVADRWYFDAGSYEAIRTNAMGCDSIINIEISTFPTSSDMRAFSICVGDSIQIHNTWQHQTGTYTETFTNSQGCDSTSVVTLSVASFLLENDSLSICDGDSIIVNGQMVYTAGLYVDTLSVDGSCQKILTTQVTLIERVEENMLLTLCPDSSAMVGNLVIDESGTFTVGLTSQAGCDSMLTIVANKLFWPQPPIIAINCQDEQYTATWTAQAPWNIEWSDGSTDTIYRQEEGGKLILRSYTDGCEKVFEYELPQIPKLSDIPKLGDRLVKGSASLPLSVDLDETSWTIAWSPEGLFSCATCFDTEVTAYTDTTITVLMTHESGCSFEQQFRIIRDVKSDISIPNIFNPTSTGGNNLWIVTLPTGSLVSEVNIYDRWGNQVFTSKNGNQISWDGNYQGKALSTGVYVYHVKVIDLDGKISMLYGDVTLVR